MRRFAVPLASLLIWLAAATSVAQPNIPAPDANANGEADATRADLSAAIAAYEAGDLVRAQALFERVHAAAPTARTLRSLALVAYKQGRFERAAALFQASLNSDVKPLSEPMRQDALDLMAAARSELARSAPAAAETGTPSTPPAALAEPAASAPASALPAHTLKADAKPSTRSRRLRRAGFTLIGLAGAALLGAGAAVLTGALRIDDIEATCRRNHDGKCSAAGVHELERAARLDLLSALANAGFALAGASALASATTLTLSYRAERGTERRTPVVGLTFRHAF